MGVLRLAAVVAVLGGGAVAGTDAAAAATLDSCRAEGRQCRLLTVPLDRSGGVSGTVRLRIERTLASDPARPPLVMVGGMPGQAATATFDPETFDWAIGDEQSSRDVIVMDLRGTGRSGALRCGALDRAGFFGTTDAGAACARSLGPRRAFYTARDSADDIEAMRQALGIEKIALFGASYGTEVAFAYAQRHPSRVDRLVLDSAVAPGGSDPLYRSSFAAVPRLVRSRCRQGMCRLASQAPVEDVLVLARRLERRPMSGAVVDGAGRGHRSRIGPFGLFRALGGGGLGSFDFVYEREIVGYARNARRGDLAPLLRAQREVRRWDRFLAYPYVARFFSYAAYAAVKCETSPLPWSRSAPLDARAGQARAFVESLPLSAFSPFGPRAALGSDVIELCRRWPIASAAPDPLRTLPPIPALLLAGEEDLTTPVSGAGAVARLIPGARLLRLHGTGHDIVYSEVSSCATRAIGKFLAGGDPGSCGRARRPSRAHRAPPLSMAEVAPEPGTRGRAGRTLGAVQLTLRDGARSLTTRFFQELAERTVNGRVRSLRQLLRGRLHVGGLRRGSYGFALARGRLVARGASYVPGVRVSGSITGFVGGSGERRGVIRVAGPAAARGTLLVRNGVLSGRLGGRHVSTRLRGSAYRELGFGDALSSQRARLARSLLR